MEAKKTPRVDLEDKRGLFLEIGLCLSLLLMIGTFAIGKSAREVEAATALPDDFVRVEMIDNTINEPEMPQAPTPKMIQSIIPDEIRIVNEPTQVQTDLIFVDLPTDAGIGEGAATAEIIPGVDPAIDFFEDVKFPPKFPRGDFVAWVQSRVRYPEMAQQMNIQGEVIIRFMVEKDGTLSSFEVMSDTNKALNNEALRVVRQSPPWTPGRQITEPVRVRMQIPVRFQLQ